MHPQSSDQIKVLGSRSFFSHIRKEGVREAGRQGGGGLDVALSSSTLSDIERAGGSFDLTGATADSLLSVLDGRLSTSAIQSWCASAGSVIVTSDGADEERKRAERGEPPEERGKVADIVEPG